jgi:hypothetical protein
MARDALPEIVRVLGAGLTIRPAQPIRPAD